MTTYLDLGIENVPEKLKRHLDISEYLRQRKKFKYCLFVSILCTFMTFLSTLIRLIVTYETIEKEKLVLLSSADLLKFVKNQEMDGRGLKAGTGSHTMGNMWHSDALNDSSSLIMVTDQAGGHPNLITVLYFLILLTIMTLNLWQFYLF